ncbi:MAG: M20/M25/M40 family metallo-hydrolase, partial [Clostridiales bacterium]|nr:M20/M25/M40 family metallo-hydrolase [Clostridiales bacterium]
MLALYITLAVLAALLLVMILRTILTKPKPLDSGVFTPHPLDKDEIAAHLSGAIQIPTVSLADDSYPDKPFLDYKKYIEETYPNFARAAKLTVISNYSLIYQIDGADKSLLPACFLSHIDVVPAPAEGWDVPPFSGAIADGCVWGRGARDMKSQMIAALEAIEYHLKNKTPFKRSIYCCFGHDEEITTRVGAPKIVEYFKSLGVEFEFVLDEGGIMLDGAMLGVSGRLALIGTCEKGYVDVKISAK